MIYDIHSHSATGGTKRVLAVVAEQAKWADEVAAQFAAEGDEVEAVWYPDSRRLIDEGRMQGFEAVILFAARDEVSGDADELALRHAMASTPLYRIGTECIAHYCQN